MSRRHPRRERILLPGEEVGRRSFLKKGLLGALLLAAGGWAAWLASRRTRPHTVFGSLQVLDGAEASVLLAVANRMIPLHPGFPRPAALGIPAKVDALVAAGHPAAQRELRRLLDLVESAAFGLLDGSPRLFTECREAEQDRRLRAWMDSRLALRRSGFRLLRGLVFTAYFGSPESWEALGYPGPPQGVRALSLEPAAQPEGEEPVPPPPPRRFRAAPIEPQILQPVPVGPVSGGRGKAP
jgi:hypothetical protein